MFVVSALFMVCKEGWTITISKPAPRSKQLLAPLIIPM